MSGRVRTLKDKGMAVFEEKVADFQKRFKKKYQEIEVILAEEVSTDVSVVKLNEYKDNLKINSQAYKPSVETFDE